jgi:hypothetical protein
MVHNCEVANDGAWIKVRAVLLTFGILLALFVFNALSMRLLPLEKASWLFGIIGVDVAIVATIYPALRPLFSSQPTAILRVDGRPCPSNLPIVRLQPPDTPFVGREGTIDALRRVVGIRDDGTLDPSFDGNTVDCRVRVLFGSFGVGKSRVAQEFALEAEQAGVSVWWMSAARKRILRCSMCQIAAMTGTSKSELMDTGCSPQQVVPYIKANLSNTRWLIVVDNADEISHLGERDERRLGTSWVFDPGPRGMILIATRDGDPGAWNGRFVRLHPIKRLDEGVAGKLLRDLSEPDPTRPIYGSDSDAVQLATMLGSLPLALRLAGRYFREIARMVATTLASGLPRTYAEYTTELRNSEVLERFFETPIGDITDDADRSTLYKSWNISLRLLDSQGFKYARPLLALIADSGEYVYPNSFDVVQLQTVPELTGLTPVVLRDTVNRMIDFGLLEVGPASHPGAVTMHPITREIAKYDRAARRSHGAIAGLAQRIRNLELGA